MEKNEQRVRIGMVARIDNSGLGVLTYDFFRNFMVEKVLIIPSRYENYYDRYEGYEGTSTILCEAGTPTIQDIDDFLEGLDLVICFETPYNWNLFTKAREKGVKTALMVMFEWTPPTKEEMLSEPDLYICPSDLDYKEMWEPKKMLPVPINRKLLPFKERTEAKTFIFNNGHGGFSGRNSPQEVLQAISLVKADVKFVIRSQVQVDSINDSRIELRLGDHDYAKLWDEGDVYIHAHKFDGLSLPLNEAMAAGVPTIAANLEPYNKILPKELLFETDGEYTVMCNRKIKSAIINPKILAAKIDEVAVMPSEKIKEISNEMSRLADNWSWDVLKKQYLDTFHELCQK